MQNTNGQQQQQEGSGEDCCGDCMSKWMIFQTGFLYPCLTCPPHVFDRV